jgi:hypothetical protein
VVEYLLADEGVGDGGLAVVPVRLPSFPAAPPLSLEGERALPSRFLSVR